MHQKHHDYYYNVPPVSNNWHTETAVRYNATMNGPPYDLAPPYESSQNRHHANISYASRSEITPLGQRGMDGGYDGTDTIEGRPPDRPIVDLQGSREQRGSAFELYRKPMHHIRYVVTFVTLCLYVCMYTGLCFVLVFVVP